MSKNYYLALIWLALIWLALISVLYCQNYRSRLDFLATEQKLVLFFTALICSIAPGFLKQKMEAPSLTSSSSLTGQSSNSTGYSIKHTKLRGKIYEIHTLGSLTKLSSFPLYDFPKLIWGHFAMPIPSPYKGFTVKKWNKTHVD